MKQPALHMRLLAAILLTALCLSACGGGTSPKDTSMSATDIPATIGGETTPACHTAPTAPSETTDTTGQTAPVDPSDAPEYTADAAGKIAAVSVGTPEEWNRFARDFNAERERFAESLDVFIETQLSFAGTVFAALTGTFSGRIHGPERGTRNAFDDYRPSILLEAARGVSRQYYWSDPDIGAGFRDISAVEGGVSLFGGKNRTLIFENLDFANISYAVQGQETVYGDTCGMLCTEAEIMYLSNVVFSSCTFENRYDMPESRDSASYLLARTIEHLRMEKVLVSRCDTDIAYGDGGLLFASVRYGAVFKKIAMLGCSVGLREEDRGDASLFGSGGQVNFADVLLFDCTVYGSNAAALCGLCKVFGLKNIVVERCGFFAEEKDQDDGEEDGLLLCGAAETYFFEGKALEGVTPENVVFENCMATLYQKDFDWYRDRGITVENCLNVTTGPAKREYQMWMYGEVYD